MARRLAQSGHPVIATSRDGGEEIPGVEWRRVELPGLWALGDVPEGALVLHSVPPVEVDGVLTDFTRPVVEALRGRAARVVYLSSTGVYGATREVDERTPAAPRTLRERLRVAAEETVAHGPWQSLVLRPAAIYGPGRGIHVSMQRGTWRLAGDGLNYVSRIHVDDLAAVAAAALVSDLTGVWPVADEQPCTSLEIARFCADLLGVAMPPAASAAELHETRRADRRVDGRAVLERLGVALRYPSYRTGIPASLAE